MADQLSGIAIIIFIAFGTLTFILLFIFAKRQIMRFALKSRRGPHVPVGSDAPKKLMRKIHQQLNAARRIQGEPLLLNKEKEDIFNETPLENISPSHLYRMKVMEDIRSLDTLIAQKHLSRRRFPGEDLKTYYFKLHRNGKFCNLNLDDLNRFFYLYEGARHEPQEFAYEEYKNFTILSEIIRSSIRGTNESSNSSMVKDFTFHENNRHVRARSDEQPLHTSTHAGYLRRKPLGLFTQHTNSVPLETPV